MTLFQAATPAGRKTAGFMLLMTSAYLVFELGFNARLLDVVGGTATHNEVELIEQYGRWISGVALTLIAWNVQIKKALTTGPFVSGLLFKLPVSAVLCITAMYFGQKALVDQLTEASTADTRARAALLVPISRLIKSNNLKLQQLDLPPAAFESPEGKAFIATFALQALAVPKLFEKIAPQADGVFRMTAVQGRGEVEKSFSDFGKSVKGLKARYVDDYSAGNRSYNAALREIPEKQRNAWADYKNSLVYRGMFGRVKRIEPDRVPPARWPEVRHGVQGKGIEVSNNWRPSDQASFNRAIEEKVRREAYATFRERTKASLKSGLGLEPNLTFDQWIASAPIQKQWRESLHLSGTLLLNPGMSIDAYNARVYEPAIKADVEHFKKERLAPVAEYADGGKFQEVGKDSARALIVPPIALTFSLLGAFTHILKSALFLAKLFVAIQGFAFSAITGGYLAAVLAVPFSFPNQVTEQPLIKTLAKHAVTELGPLKGGTINGSVHWVIHLQKYFYVVNEKVRVGLLQGFSYGYQSGGAVADRASGAESRTSRLVKRQF